MPCQRLGKSITGGMSRRQLLRASATVIAALLTACGHESPSVAGSVGDTSSPAPTRIVRVSTPDPTATTIPPVHSGPVELVGVIDKEFHMPVGMAIDRQMNVFVLDTTPRLYKFAPSGRLLFSSGSLGDNTGQFRLTDGGILGTGITADALGNVYVADTGNARIQKFDGNGGFLTTWGNQGNGDGQFSFPHGVAIHQTQNTVYVADTNNNRIQAFNGLGSFLTAWSLGSTTLVDIVVAPNGEMFGIDAGGNRIQHFTDSGQILNTWGTYGASTGQLYRPLGGALDSSGTIYVADTGNHRIQRFDRTGNFIDEWGSRGSSNTQFSFPLKVAVDSMDIVYVLDMGNNRILKFRMN